MAERVLIIGGAGYIGTNLTEKLVKGGHEVTVYDSLVYGDGPLKRTEMVLSGSSLADALRADVGARPLRPQGFRFVKGDTRDREKVSQEIGSGYTVVFHLGELVGIAACETNAAHTRDVNFVGSKNVIDGVLASSHQPRFFWNSTSSVYHISTDGREFTEASQLPPDDELDNYCINKVGIERYMQEKAAQSNDITWTIFRPATVGGLSPRMRIELLPNHLPYSMLVTGEFALARPHDRRAVVDIDDLTGLYATLVNQPDHPNGIYNVGFVNVTKGEFAEEVAQVVGLGEGAINIVPQAGDLRSLTISSELAGIFIRGFS